MELLTNEKMLERENQCQYGLKDLVPLTYMTNVKHINYMITNKRDNFACCDMDERAGNSFHYTEYTT